MIFNIEFHFFVQVCLSDGSNNIKSFFKKKTEKGPPHSFPGAIFFVILFLLAQRPYIYLFVAFDFFLQQQKKRQKAPGDAGFLGNRSISNFDRRYIIKMANLLTCMSRTTLEIKTEP